MPKTSIDIDKCHFFFLLTKHINKHSVWYHTRLPKPNTFYGIISLQTKMLLPSHKHFSHPYSVLIAFSFSLDSPTFFVFVLFSSFCCYKCFCIIQNVDVDAWVVPTTYFYSIFIPFPYTLLCNSKKKKRRKKTEKVKQQQL